MPSPPEPAESRISKRSATTSPGCIGVSIAHFGSVDARCGGPIDFPPLPDPKKPGFGTLSVRGGEPRKKAYDAVTVPVALTATYGFSGAAEIRDHFEGRVEREEYGRYGNPTVR